MGAKESFAQARPSCSPIQIFFCFLGGKASRVQKNSDLLCSLTSSALWLLYFFQSLYESRSSFPTLATSVSFSNQCECVYAWGLTSLFFFCFCTKVSLCISFFEMFLYVLLSLVLRFVFLLRNAPELTRAISGETRSSRPCLWCS